MHAKTVYGFLLTRTGNPDTAEELTQETFCRALKQVNRFRGDSSVSTWLCGIAKNVWLEYVKKAKRRNDSESVREDPGAGEAADWAAGHSLWDSYMIKWENMEILKILHSLKEPVRETMYLRLIGNLTFAQIGEIMGRSENWARVTFYRGKETIMKEVKGHERQDSM
jgi:RNA polymerase sigma-70 factor (ECF subfamily)